MASVGAETHARWRAPNDSYNAPSRDWAARSATVWQPNPARDLNGALALETGGPHAAIAIRTIEDIVTARRLGRLLAQAMGFSGSRITLITTAISELARNIVQYAGFGEITLSQLRTRSSTGVEVAAHDHGPGIADIQRVLSGGYSTSGGLGLGLCGLRRIADEFQLNSRPGHGTHVTVKVWSQPDKSS